MKPCSAVGCERPTRRRMSMCGAHHMQTLRARRKYAIVCAQCGDEAQVDRPTTRFCSLSCASLANAAKTATINAKHAAERRRRRSQVVLYSWPSHAKSRHDVPHVKGKLTWRNGQCKVCATWFTHWNGDVTCSPDCQRQWKREVKRDCKHRRRATKANAFVEKVYRRTVYEADGYRCHLCNKKTDPTKTAPHPRSPTLDHVIPLSKGGTHERANVRTACFLCNSRKGDRGHGEQFALAF